MHLEDELKKEQTKTQDLNRELDIQQNLQAGLTERVAELQLKLTVVERNHSQTVNDLEKRKAEVEDLIGQLEYEKKLQKEERESLQVEMDSKITELQRRLNEAEESIIHIESELKKEQSKAQDLNRELAIQLNLQVEMNEKIAVLQRTLADAENDKSLLLGDLEQSKAKIVNLVQCELQKQIETEALERLQIEMKEKIADMEQALAAAENDKSQIADELRKGKDEIEKLSSQLNSQKKQQIEECERLQAELNEKSAEMRRALADAQKDKSQLADFATASLRTEMLEKVLLLQQSLDQEKEKSEEINCQYMQVKKQADDLDVQCTKLMQKLSEDRTEISNLQKELATKDTKLEELKALYEEKQKQFEKSYQDNEILSVKLYKARSVLKEKEDAWAKSLQDSKKAMEEKLRDARIEFDSTMEKMKERMKELHKEVKTKLECDNQGLALTADGYRRKVDNLEIRCTKLQKQLAEMNERNLEVRKENQHLQVKLKTFEEYGTDRKSLMLPNQASLRSNLRMEDEEGELFNNMYLADLKSGRCVSPGPTNGGLDRYSELTQRNSKLLPHLRTNYVALAPDCEPPHDDTRDNMSSSTFDDSSTGLITRRKVSGITSYKRPGPPTPSKRAGRFSLNGALVGNGGEIQYKDALRDANANAAPTGAGTATDVASSTRAGRTKTPGKFKQMISSSSLLNNFQRDEGNTSAMPNATRRLHQCDTDCNQDMRSDGPNSSMNVVATRKRLQRKMLFDSNRCLASGLPCQYGFETGVPPLYTILKCSAPPKENSLEQDNGCVGGDMARLAMTTRTATTLTATVTDITNATTTATTPILATAAHPEPVAPLAVSDYSFKHPYGSNRYNILRIQEQSREKRRQLYDETRKVTAKGMTVPTPPVSNEPSTNPNNDHDMNTTNDTTLYLSFTSDTEDSSKT
uniref:Uncharacterized protein n=1 Tax=Anopheles culicifacies TaxID=139723 RepID=A0A182LT53_9DIPT